MLLRAFLQSLTALVGGVAMPMLAHASRKKWKTLQVSSVDRLQYHNGEALWSQLAADQQHWPPALHPHIPPKDVLAALAYATDVLRKKPFVTVAEIECMVNDRVEF